MAHARGRSLPILRAGVAWHDACELPSIVDVTAATAYYIPNANCVHIMLGLLRSPFADGAFDDTQLSILVGFFIAHEIGHATVHSAVDVSSLLSRYESPSVHLEALADVVAMSAILSATDTTDAAACHRVWDTVGQLFCSSTDVPSESDDTHPMGNTRVDRLWQTFVDHFPSAYTCHT